jgi:hypothetical protein
MMIMKPMTTPGKASGKVRTAISVSRPGKRLRTRNSPLVTEIARVTAVASAASATVITRLAR